MFDLTFVQAAKNNEKYTSNIRTFTPKLCMILSTQNVLEIATSLQHHYISKPDTCKSGSKNLEDTYHSINSTLFNHSGYESVEQKVSFQEFWS